MRCPTCGKSQWIDASHREPNIDERVLCYIPKRCGAKIVIGYLLPEDDRDCYFDGNEYYWFIDESENTAFLKHEVTHWMPLPEIDGED